MRFLSSVAKHRNLYCRHYDECLGVAVKASWEGWTCVHCELSTQPGEMPDVIDFAIAGRRD